MTHPREQTALFGREAAEAQFMDALGADRLHHAWLISGPRGTGKATLAYRIARSMLAGEWGVGGAHPVFRRIAAHSHTDLLVLEAPEDAEKDESKREIPIELARGVGGFLALTPAEGDWRIVIIDSVDELNTNAANAILKLLEEPPPRSLLLLTSHNPGRLLPTIRSRCRNLKLGPLSREAFEQTMAHIAPAQSREDTRVLGVLSDFSPGLALSLKKHDGAGVYEALVQYIHAPQRAAPLLDIISGAAPHTQWQLLSHLIGRFHARALECANDMDFEALDSAEEAALCGSLAGQSLPAIAERYAKLQTQFSVAARSHLDYKTILLTLLPTLKNKHAA